MIIENYNNKVLKRISAAHTKVLLYNDYAYTPSRGKERKALAEKGLMYLTLRADAEVHKFQLQQLLLPE
jgi:hypothetical protein